MTLVLSEVDARIGRITLNRPERMNAISVQLARELEAAIVTLGERHDVNAIVIRGAGQNFCAGGDFEEVQRLREEGVAELRELFTAFKSACDAIAHTKVPVIAAVEGVAMAGGFELMQAVDIVLVADNARIADNHINFGMIPGGGSTARLPRIVGRQQAMALLLSGDKISGVDAVEMGLAYDSYQADSFSEQVERFLDRLRSRDYSAITTIKRLITEGLTTDLDTANLAETDAVVWRLSGSAGQAGVTAFKNREVTS